MSRESETNADTMKVNDNSKKTYTHITQREREREEKSEMENEYAVRTQFSQLLLNYIL